MAGAPDLQRLALGTHAVALVDVVDAFTVPHAAVTFVGSYCDDSRFGSSAFNTFGSDLIARFVSDEFATLEGQTVIVGKFANGANVNHSMYYLPFLGTIIISYFAPFVNTFLKLFQEKIRRNTSKSITKRVDT